MKSNASNFVTRQQKAAPMHKLGDVLWHLFFHLSWCQVFVLRGCVAIVHEIEACKRGSPIEIHYHMQAVDGGNCVDMHTLFTNRSQNRGLGWKIHGYSSWDADRVIHIDFLEAGTINSERYIATLETLEKQLRKVQKHEKNHFATT